MREVLITEDAHRVLWENAERAHPIETGGVLLGVRARRSVWITDVVELLGEGSSTRYNVPKGMTVSAVERARTSIDSRLGYLGEWHSHTTDSGPSRDDAATMRAIS